MACAVRSYLTCMKFLTLCLCISFPLGASKRKFRHAVELEHESDGCFDVNTAPASGEHNLRKILGIGHSSAQAIIDGRPYHGLSDFEEKMKRLPDPAISRAILSVLAEQPGVLCANVDVSIVSAGCYDVNMAPVQGHGNLQKISGIGELAAQAIADGRPYSSMSDFESKIKALPNRGIARAVWKVVVEQPDVLCWKNGGGGGGGGTSHPSTRRRTRSNSGSQGSFKSPSSYALEDCQANDRMPPKISIPDNGTALPEMRIALYKRRVHKFTILDPANVTDEYRNECLKNFPQQKRTTTDEATVAKSIGVCILVNVNAANGTGYWHALEYSSYNNERKIPNFVAYRIMNRPALHSSQECRAAWKPVCPESYNRNITEDDLNRSCKGVVDFHYSGTGLLNTNHCPDPACLESISSRGHMSPVKHNSWSLSLCSSTMMFLNVFPSRQPFDGEQWSHREAHINTYLSKQPPESFLWSVVGVSRQSDGTILSKRLNQDVDVPSWVWTAIYDPVASKATAWMCRNGLSKTKDCFCVDRLSIRELESVVGYTIFPGLTEGMVDLEDGSHPTFWESVYP